jgi:hypothetical protein
VTPIVVAVACPGSIWIGPDHDRPFHTKDPPDSSTAVQNEAVGHETPAKEDGSEKESGMVHREPFHCEMPPEADTQNDDETHEMADTDPQSPLVPDHVPPLYAKAFPWASTAAQ